MSGNFELWKILMFPVGVAVDAKKATKEPTKKSHGHHGHSTKAHKGHSKAHEKTTTAAETAAP